MPQPDLVVLAEGDLPGGQHWILKGGGTRDDFYTFLETIYPDGHRDEGGMGGKLLSPGSLMNTYTGGSDQGLRRLVVRADPHVAVVRVELASGALLDLPPVATRSDLGVSFFATLLSPTEGLVSVTALGADGRVLEPQNLSAHEEAWQWYLQRQREEFTPGMAPPHRGPGPRAVAMPPTQSQQRPQRRRGN
jgi:hypothetical protein